MKRGFLGEFLIGNHILSIISSIIPSEKANKYWEHNLPKDFHRPNWESKDTTQITNFIKDKYVNKKWAPKIDYQTYLKTGETEIKQEEKTSKDSETKEFPTFDLLGLC